MAGTALALLGAALAAPLPAGAADNVPAVQGVAGQEMAGQEVAAQNDMHTFNIPPQPLASALRQFADQADASFAYKTGDISAIRSPGVRGTMTVREALGRLLAGTGIAFEFVDARTVTLTGADGSGSILLNPVTVVGAVPQEDGRGPVEGYVAGRSAAATKTNTPLARTPQSITVVPKAEIEDQDAESVAQALRYSASVFAEYRGESNLHDEVFVRGFSYVPRYLDGLEYGWSSLGQVDPYLLERVEVVRGPSSLLYGQTNPGGLVNLASKKPTGETLREVRVGVGLDNRFEGGFDFAGLLTDDRTVSYRIVGAGERFDLTQDHVQQERLALMPSLKWQIGDDTDLTLLAFVQWDPDGGYRNFMEAKGTVYPTRFGFIPEEFFVGDPDFEEVTSFQSSLGYEFSHAFDDTFTFRQNTRYGIIKTTHKTMVWGALAADDRTISRTASGGSRDQDQFVIDNQLQADFTTGMLDHTFLAGLDFKYSYQDYVWARNTSTTPSIDWLAPVYGVNPGTLVPSSNNDTYAWQTGLYAQDQVDLGNLTVVFGLRHDWAETEIDDHLAMTEQTFSDSAFSGRAGVLYAFDNGISPYASYSTSFEPVTQAPPAGAGVSRFEPVTASQYEVGVRYAPKGTNIQLIASAYQATQQNVLSYDPAIFGNRQIGEIENKGVELEGHAELFDNLSLAASYSYVSSEVKVSARTTEIGKMPARIPQHQAKLWGRYDFDQGALDGLGLGLGARYTGKSFGDSTNSFTVPHVTLFDAALYYDLGALRPEWAGLKFQVNATNLADTRHVSSCASLFACWWGPSRTVTASLKYTW